MFMLLFLGLGLGVITLVPPGPVSVTLVQVAVRRGRSSGVRAGAAVASADLVTGVAAIAVLGLGASTLPALAASMSVVAACVMAIMGCVLIGRPVGFAGLAAGIGRPASTLFALTAFNPLTLLSWIALIAAVPAADTLARQAALAAGVVLASCVWHPFLGFAAGRVGQDVDPRTTARLTRASGVILVILGAVFALGG